MVNIDNYYSREHPSFSSQVDCAQTMCFSYISMYFQGFTLLEKQLQAIANFFIHFIIQKFCFFTHLVEVCITL